MGVKDLYRNRASLGRIPYLPVSPSIIGSIPAGQVIGVVPFRLQVDANTVGLWNFDDVDRCIALTMGFTKIRNQVDAAVKAGTITSLGTWGTLGPWGSSWAGDGTADFITLAADGLSTGDFTVEAVCKIAPLPSSGGVWQYTLLGQYEASETYLFWMFGPRGYPSGSKGKLIVYGKGASVAAQVGNTAVDDGLWHYLTCVINRTGNVCSTYIDGAIDINGAGWNVGAGSFSQIPVFAKGGVAGAPSYLPVTLAQARYSTGIRPAAEILTNAKLMGLA